MLCYLFFFTDTCVLDELALLKALFHAHSKPNCGSNPSDVSRLYKSLGGDWQPGVATGWRG